MKKIILALFASSILTAQTVESTFEKCVNKRPTECGFFNNHHLWKRVINLMTLDRLNSVLIRDQFKEAVIVSSRTDEHWIGKSQFYIEALLWGTNEYREKTRLFIQFNKETKKINVYWKEGVEWRIVHEDSFIPDKLIFISKQNY